MSGHAGTLLRDARRSRGLLQWETAKQAGMHPSRLRGLERGADRIRLGDARRLGPVVGVDPAALMRAPAPFLSSQRSAWRETSVRTFRDIPRTCRCDWRMTTVWRRPSGWVLELAHPGCRHHGTEAAA